MILNREQTDFFFAGCHFKNETGDVSDLWKVLYGASWVSNAEYDALLTLWDTWEAEYNNTLLYGTPPTGSTFLIDVDKIPKRPKR